MVRLLQLLELVLLPLHLHLPKLFLRALLQHFLLAAVPRRPGLRELRLPGELLEQHILREQLGEHLQCHLRSSLGPQQCKSLFHWCLSMLCLLAGHHSEEYRKMCFVM